MSRSNSPKRKKGKTPYRQPADGRCPSTGKRQWPTRALAKAHKRNLAGSGDLALARLGTYRCLSCDTWHVGHRGIAPQA
jgi:hypothetical protein